MNIHDLRQAQVQFENQIESIKEQRKDLYRLRDSFTNYFNLERIATMTIDDYVAGKGKPGKGQHNFCYTLERELKELGSISGANAMKFGVYYGKWGEDTKDYRFVERFGHNYQEAFENIRNSLLRLIEAGLHEDIEAIIGNPITQMVKAKILSTYYPEKYLNIFASDHLDHYLNKLDLATQELLAADPVYRRQELIKFKNNDPVMKNWSVDLFAYFLWELYPGRPPKESEKINDNASPLAAYRQPTFPAIQQGEFIELNALPPSQNEPMTTERRAIARRKTDYEKEARKLRLLGDRGEKVVMDLEKKKLMDAGKKNLAAKVERVSLQSDALGYDILSFEEDGSEKYIEVKATRAKTGAANFFLTANELRSAKELKNYYVYMVYDVTSQSPKVWAINNPFKPANENVVMNPTNFRVSINANET